MIKGLYSGGRYIQVNNGSPSWPSVYNNSYNSSGGSAFSGQVRYNSQAGGMEIFDGNNWQRIGDSIAQVSLSPEAEHLLEWVKQKILEEADLKARMQRHPGLKDAYEKFKVMDALTLEENCGAESESVQAGP